MGDKNGKTIPATPDKTQEIPKVNGNFFNYLFHKIRKKDFDPLSKGIIGVLEEKKAFDSVKKAEEEKYNTYEAIMTASKSTAEYYSLLVISCLIALFGLYQNSAATIIGAMIVAPLMGPIMGLSAGVLWGKINDIFISVFSLVKGIVIVILITGVLTFLIPNIVVTQEMLSRTYPSVFDIIIAVCCGLIGAYGIVNRKVSSTLTGVAISVALMPPLCTAGIGIGLQNLKIAEGAALLFIINLLGISLGSIIVFYLVRMHPLVSEESGKSEVKKRALGQIFISLALISIISVILFYFTFSTYEIISSRNIARNILSLHLKEDKIYSLDLSVDKESLKISAITLGNKDLGDNKRQNIETEISNKIKKPVSLKLYSINEYNTGGMK